MRDAPLAKAAHISSNRPLTFYAHIHPNKLKLLSKIERAEDIPFRKAYRRIAERYSD